MWSSNSNTFEIGGLVCYADTEDRRSLVIAHQARKLSCCIIFVMGLPSGLEVFSKNDFQGFVEGLAGAEACAMVFHGYLDSDAGSAVSLSWLEIQDRLAACFAGCIEVNFWLCPQVLFSPLQYSLPDKVTDY
jgi:hypothetical protein